MDVNTTESNHSDEHITGIYNITVEDSNWILTAAFIIFTMQTGFGMLESGCVSRKNEMNIMMKNVVDIFLGGICYWAVGFGMSFGTNWSCPFIAFGDWFFDAPPGPHMGPKFTSFIFQLSFATTATTIVSGAMAERCSFKAYCLFSLLNSVVYCVPAGWVWGDHGFLKKLGNVDIAGSGPVHLVGGASALASAMSLGPRLGRYDNGNAPLPLGTPVNCAMGLFVLWWGWLAFNSGSTYGVSGSKWAYAAKAAVMTMISSFGGGVVGLAYSLAINHGHANILHIINSVLGSLVSVTAGCFLYTSIDALIIGSVGAVLTSAATPLFDLLKIDDPVGATAVHGVSGIWGVLAVGLFAEDPIPLETTSGRTGALKGGIVTSPSSTGKIIKSTGSLDHKKKPLTDDHETDQTHHLSTPEFQRLVLLKQLVEVVIPSSGGFYLLGVQTLGALCLATYSFSSSYIILWCINKITPLRMSAHEELLGADLSEHLIRHNDEGVTRAIESLLKAGVITKDYTLIKMIGSNPGHDSYLKKFIQKKNNNEKTKKNKGKMEGRVLSIFNSVQPNETTPNFAWMD